MFGEYVRHVGEFARMEGLTEEVDEKNSEEKVLRKQLKAYQGIVLFVTKWLETIGFF